MGIITRRRGSVRLHACVCVLRSRILTNETNKFAPARMRTCWWKFPDSRESSRVRSLTLGKMSDFFAYVIERVTDNWSSMSSPTRDILEWKKVAGFLIICRDIRRIYWQ